MEIFGENIANENEEGIQNDSYIDIIGIIEKINRNIIRFKTTNNIVNIDSKSIAKIFSIIESHQNILDIYINHITIIILSPNESPIINNKENLVNNNLESNNIYSKILDETNIFHINFEQKNQKKVKNKALLKVGNIKIIIYSKSLKKIFRYLDMSLFDMSDYINLVILYLNENNIAEFINRHKIFEKIKLKIKVSWEKRSIIQI